MHACAEMYRPAHSGAAYVSSEAARCSMDDRIQGKHWVRLLSWLSAGWTQSIHGRGPAEVTSPSTGMHVARLLSHVLEVGKRENERILTRHSSTYCAKLVHCKPSSIVVD